MPALPGEIWRPRRIVEDRYRRALHDLIDMFVDGLTGADLSSPESVLELFHRFVNTETFGQYIRAVAGRMVGGMAVDNARTWREAARKSLKGRKVYEALRKEMQGPVGGVIAELVDENAKLISTFPERISNQVAHFIQRQQLKGLRPEAITDDLIREFPNITRGRLQLIARTESAKASSALVRARAEEVELEWYVWRTSKDARVRHAHRKMDGILICWQQPPNPELLFPEAGVKAQATPYHAGGTFNCRCYSEVLVDPGQVTWPLRVFWNERVHMMTRAHWERVSNYRQAA